MIYLKDKAIAHLLAHKGVQLSHLESQLIPKIGIMSENRHGNAKRFRRIQKPSKPSQIVP